jgi:type II secretory pathway pseudopilin PulG
MLRRAPRFRWLAPARRARADTGSTLVELLAAVTIMGSAVVALLTGMSTLFVNSAQNRQATNAGVVARNYAEGLELAVAQPGVWCGSSYSTAYAPPAEDLVTLAYGACPIATKPQFQTIKITVTAAGGDAETLVIVVRKP